MSRIATTRLDRDELANCLCSGRTSATVANWLVGQGELTQIVSKHVGLDLDCDEALTVVHTNRVADHVGSDGGVAEVSLDRLRLLTELQILLLHDGKTK